MGLKDDKDKFYEALAAQLEHTGTVFCAFRPNPDEDECGLMMSAQDAQWDGGEPYCLDHVDTARELRILRSVELPSFMKDEEL